MKALKLIASAALVAVGLPVLAALAERLAEPETCAGTSSHSGCTVRDALLPRAKAAESMCDNLNRVRKLAYDKAASCEKRLNLDSCNYSAWCDNTDPCIKASRCYDPARTNCGKVHAKCFNGDAKACAQVPAACEVCVALSNDCAKCNPASDDCERKAMASATCGKIVGEYVTARRDWQSFCSM